MNIESLYHSTMSGNHFYDNGEQIEFHDSYYNLIFSNYGNIHSTNSFFTLFSSKNNTVTDNSIPRIRLVNSHGNHLSNNSLSHPDFSCIYLTESHENTIVDNHCSYSYNGIVLKYSNINVVYHNSCFNNSENGILLQQALNNTIQKNQCYRNINGMLIMESMNNTIINNSFHDNEEGLKFAYGAHNNTISYNRIYGNSEFGIDAYSNEYLERLSRSIPLKGSQHR